MAIEDVTGTAANTDAKDQGTDTSQVKEGASEGQEGAQDTFYKLPADLDSLTPADLREHHRRMQQKNTKLHIENKQLTEKAQLVDRFSSDPQFALQTIQQAAQQMGYSLTKAQAAQVASAAAPSVGGDAPPQLVEAVRAKLNPELQWMAPALANTQWVAMQMQMAPLQKEREQERVTRRNEQYSELAEELTETAPGWEEHEDEMEELLTFLKSDSMKHRKFGSKLTLLHGIVTGNASAIANAVRRMGEAGRNRTGTGQVSRTTTPNVDKRVRDAKTTQEAWDIAAKHAVEELERHGVTLR